MVESTRTVTARCLCGSAKHEITLPASAFPLTAELCHCNSCRSMTGTLCFTVAFIPKDEYEPSEELLSKLKPFAFSKKLEEYFCPTCGTHMLTRCRDPENLLKTASWDVLTGSLDQADGVFEVTQHDFIADTLDGGFSDFLQTIEGKQVPRWPYKPDGEQLPQYWLSPNRPKVNPSSNDKLHAHCKCGGVSFYISRPSERSILGKAPWPDLIVPYQYTGTPPPQDQAWWLAARGTKFTAGLCACNSCRLACGTEWAAWAFVPIVDITLDAEGAVPFEREFGALRHYESSPGTVRRFCGTCGATVFWHGVEKRPGVIDVAVGLLDAAEGARAENWLEWRTTRLSYREDAYPREKALTEAVEAGLQAYGEHKQGTKAEHCEGARG